MTQTMTERRPLNPLQWPGGKTRAVPILQAALLKALEGSRADICSPFIGGGSFELFCANKLNLRIKASDSDADLINFWCAMKETRALLIQGAHVERKKLEACSTLKLKRETCYHVWLKNMGDMNLTKLDRAVAFLCVNRTSYSGMMASRGYSDKSARAMLTHDKIARLNDVGLDNITFEHADFEDAIRRHGAKCFLFLDPPYYLGAVGSRIYRGHKSFDHQRLAHVLLSTTLPRGWLLCYNNCAYITNLYKQCPVQVTDWAYGRKARKEDETGKELLIFAPTRGKQQTAEEADELSLADSLANVCLI